jgi:hypothetical protein
VCGAGNTFISACGETRTRARERLQAPKNTTKSSNERRRRLLKYGRASRESRLYLQESRPYLQESRPYLQESRSALRTSALGFRTGAPGFRRNVLSAPEQCPRAPEDRPSSSRDAPCSRRTVGWHRKTFLCASSSGGVAQEARPGAPEVGEVVRKSGPPFRQDRPSGLGSVEGFMRTAPPFPRRSCPWSLRSLRSSGGHSRPSVPCGLLSTTPSIAGCREERIGNDGILPHRPPTIASHTPECMWQTGRHTTSAFSSHPGVPSAMHAAPQSISPHRRSGGHHYTLGDPLSLLCRLAMSVPPPRFHIVK